jgi:hypothetical protein
MTQFDEHSLVMAVGSVSNREGGIGRILPEAKAFPLPDKTLGCEAAALTTRMILKPERSRDVAEYQALPGFVIRPGFELAPGSTVGKEKVDVLDAGTLLLLTSRRGAGYHQR